MKKTLATLLLAALAAAAPLAARASSLDQLKIGNDIPSGDLTLPAAHEGPLLAANDVAPPTVTDTNLAGLNLPGITAATDWAVVPYGIFRTDNKTWGYGAAVFYEATKNTNGLNLWIGARVNYLDGRSVTAGVTAQLQATIVWHGVSITPAVIATTGIGKDQLYGSAGVGGYIIFHSWSFKLFNHGFILDAGAAGDYEHVVYGSDNYDEVCFGPLGALHF